MCIQEPDCQFSNPRFIAWLNKLFNFSVPQFTDLQSGDDIIISYKLPFGPVAVRASLQSVTLEVHSALLCLSFPVVPWGLFQPTVSYLPGSKDSTSSLSTPTPHTVATQWVFSAHVDGWKFKSLLSCFVCFFWVSNKIPEVRVSLEGQKYPQMEGFLIPLSSLLFDSGKMLDKI